MPDFVLEVISPKSVPNDLVTKRRTYERLGVREYFLYDPWGLTMEHRLQGEVLRDGCYRPMERRADGSIRSEALGLALRLRGEEQDDGYRELLFQDPRTGTDLETHAMVHASRREAQERAAAERRERVRLQRRVQDAASRIAELEQQLLSEDSEPDPEAAE